MPTLAFDGVLKAWRIAIFCDGIAIIGQVYGDKKRRFCDGRWVLTSAVVTPRSKVVSGNVIRTRNSRYLLVGSIH